MSVMIPIALVMVLIAVLAMLWAMGVVYLGRTRGGWTIVRDDSYVVGQRVRVLEVASTYQSATYLDDRWTELVFRYHQLYEHFFDDWPGGGAPRTVAVLGGGGYALPKHLVAHHPELERIDVVELDAAIEDIARRFFFLDRLEERYHAEESGRLRLHVDDAFHWLEQQDERYDAILNDCFVAIAPDKALASSSGTRTIACHLTPEGIYLTNVISALSGPESGHLYALIHELEQEFAHIWVYPCNPHEPEQADNNIVVAAQLDRHLENAWTWPPDETSL